MTLRFRAAYLAAAILLAAPRLVAAQCAAGAAGSEDFAANMKGCAGAVSFASRASLCATGWHVCTAQEWVNRSGGKVPGFNYWTADNLRQSFDGNGCFASSAADSIDAGCSPSPMRVCTVGRGDFDAAYGGPSKVYTVQTFPADGTITLVNSLDRSTLASQTFIGSVAVAGFAPVFVGGRLGGPGGLSLTFAADGSGSDGSATFTRLATQPFLVDAGSSSSVDPLGNTCLSHNCGLNAGLPNRYFGGCGDPTAGTLCCQ